MASFDQSRSFIATISAQFEGSEAPIIVTSKRENVYGGLASEGWLGTTSPKPTSSPMFWFGCHDYGAAGVMYEIRAYKIQDFEGCGLDISTNGYLGLYSNASSSLHWTLTPSDRARITQPGRYAGLQLGSKQGPVRALLWQLDSFMYLNVTEGTPQPFNLEVKTMGIPRP